MPIRKKKTGVPRGVSDDHFRIAKSDNKIKLFGKFNNRWYAVPMQDAFEDVFGSDKKKAKIRDKRMSDMMKFLNLKKAKHGGTLRGVGQALKGFGKAKYSNKLF